MDVMHGSPRDPVKHYAIRAQAVRDAHVHPSSDSHPAHPTDTRSVRRSHWLRLAANLDWWALLSGAAVFPLANVNSFDRMSPWLILHGARDTIIPIFNARQLAKLRDMEHGVCKLSIHDEEGHGQRPPHLY
jgi:hypothetical protein